MAISKRTLTIVGATIMVAATLDIVTYSIGKSRGGPFKVFLPRGKDLGGILLLGLIEGIFVDRAIKLLDYTLMPAEEKSLETVVNEEKKKIETGQIKNKQATGVIWA